jgi:2-phospho-L-lactate guanylyltransferase
MNLAVVPVKRLSAGKSRLAAALGRETVEALTLAMLGDVLDAIRSAGRVDRVVVATPDPEVGEAARLRRRGARGRPGLNAALDAAAALAGPAGARWSCSATWRGAAPASRCARSSRRDGAVLAPATAFAALCAGHPPHPPLREDSARHRARPRTGALPDSLPRSPSTSTASRTAALLASDTSPAHARSSPADNHGRR